MKIRLIIELFVNKTLSAVTSQSRKIRLLFVCCRITQISSAQFLNCCAMKSCFVKTLFAFIRLPPRAETKGQRALWIVSLVPQTWSESRVTTLLSPSHVSHFKIILLSWYSKLFQFVDGTIHVLSFQSSGHFTIGWTFSLQKRPIPS